MLRSGRDFVQEDFDQYRKVCLIDRTVSESLFSGTNPVGQIVEISGEPYTIIGEFTQSSQFTPVIKSLEDYYTYAGRSGGQVLLPITTWPVLYSYDEPVAVVLQATSTDDMTTAGKQAADLPPISSCCLLPASLCWWAASAL